MEKKNDNKGTNNGNRGKTVINNTSNTACNDETSSEYAELCHWYSFIFASDPPYEKKAQFTYIMLHNYRKKCHCLHYHRYISSLPQAYVDYSCVARPVENFIYWKVTIPVPLSFVLDQQIYLFFKVMDYSLNGESPVAHWIPRSYANTNGACK